MFKVIKMVIRKRLAYLVLSLREQDMWDGIKYLFGYISLDVIRKLEPYYVTLQGYQLSKNIDVNSHLYTHYLASVSLLNYCYKKQVRHNKRAPQYYIMRHLDYPLEQLRRYVRMFKVEANYLGITYLELYLENYVRLDIDDVRDQFEELLEIRLEGKSLTEYLVSNLDRLKNNQLPVKVSDRSRNLIYISLKVRGYIGEDSVFSSKS